MITPDVETNFIEIVVEVLQGDTFAPYRFAIVLDHAMRKAIDGEEERLTRTEEININKPL